MKNILTVTLLIMLTILKVEAANKCKDGFSSSWSFDQNKEKIAISKAYPMKVCIYITKQSVSNFELKFIKKDKTVHSMQIFWRKEIVGDVFDKNQKMRPISFKKTDYRLLKIPVPIKDIDRYEVIEISTKKLFGSGKVIESKIDKTEKDTFEEITI